MGCKVLAGAVIDTNHQACYLAIEELCGELIIRKYRPREENKVDFCSVS